MPSARVRSRWAVPQATPTLSEARVIEWPSLGSKTWIFSVSSHSFVR